MRHDLDNDYEELIKWLVDTTNYPFDFSTPEDLPPVRARKAVEDRWVERDATNEDEADNIRLAVADEGGWFE